ncbi:aminotransferase class V-fold PLP-dependent enzyme [Bacillus sp. N9]
MHNFGGKSEQLLTRAREQIADLCNVKPAEIYFTSGGTEANNLAIKGAAMMHKARETILYQQ